MFDFLQNMRSGTTQMPQSGPVTTAFVSAATRIGSRSGNQDTFRAGKLAACSPARRSFSRAAALRWDGAELFCVCDGVGGAYRGDSASRGALLAIDNYLRWTDVSQLPLSRLVMDSAEAAQQWVQQFYARNGLAGGCTLTMVGIRGDAYAFLNIGDSPAFLLPPDGGFAELSLRHNLAWENMRNNRPVRPGDESQLLHYLGMPDIPAECIAHTQIGYLEPGRRILLCSDGVTNELTSEYLEQALRSGATAAQITLEASLASCSDNCTMVCLEILTIEEMDTTDS